MDIVRLEKKLEKYGISMEKTQFLKLESYADLLQEWNKKINLTAITEAEEIEDKHFVDSLILAAQPEVAGSLADIGSGAGFPGVVAKIYNPTLEVTLIEPTSKKIMFQREVISSLGLGGIVAVKERAEEAARKKWRETFDVATARAVAALPVLCEYALPLLKIGGYFIAMKGGEAEAELSLSEAAISKLGGKYIKTMEFSLPDGSARSLIFILKEEPTPKLYPRNGGTIAKRPL